MKPSWHSRDGTRQQGRVSGQGTTGQEGDRDRVTGTWQRDSEVRSDERSDISPGSKDVRDLNDELISTLCSIEQDVRGNQKNLKKLYRHGRESFITTVELIPPA